MLAPPFHRFATAATPNTCAASAFSLGCGIPPTTKRVLKKSSPVESRHLSPPSAPVGAAHHSDRSLESDSSSTENEPRTCDDSIMIRYQVARESLIAYSSMFGK